MVVGAGKQGEDVFSDTLCPSHFRKQEAGRKRLGDLRGQCGEGVCLMFESESDSKSVFALHLSVCLCACVCLCEQEYIIVYFMCFLVLLCICVFWCQGDTQAMILLLAGASKPLSFCLHNSVGGACTVM